MGDLLERYSPRERVSLVLNLSEMDDNCCRKAIAGAMRRMYNFYYPRAPSPASLSVLSLLMAGYAAIVLLHLNLLSPYFHAGIGVYFESDGPNIIGSLQGDEALYRIYAESLLHLAAYPANPNYPPVYPLLLALAELLSPADPIKAMIVANILAASAVMFPVYALARQMLARDLAFAAAIVAGFLPASFIFAPALMSENLSTTLFVTAVWLAVRRRPAKLPMAGLFGTVLAACFLTKFFLLATIPFLGAASLINQWMMTAPLPAHSMHARLMARLAMVAAAAGTVPVALWSAYLVASGGTVAQSLGYNVATINNVGPHPPLAFITPILVLHGLVLVAMELPVLPAVLVGILGRQRMPILLYVILLGAMMTFMWLFVTVYAWFSLELFGYPQPIIQRYFMMLVPIFIPLAFVGLKRILNRAAGPQSWRALALVGLLSLALAILVQAAYYDSIIWPIPVWTTRVWVTGCDILYGAIGFPVIAVTAVTVGTLVALRLVIWFDRWFGLKWQRALRLGGIAIATSGLVMFNIATGLTGAHFAWSSPYLAINAAHARAFSAIIGDRSRDPRPAVVSVDRAVFDTIERSTGVQLREDRWWENLSFWSGRQITVVEAENPSPYKPRYWVSLARPGADPATVYQVGAESFQVKTTPDR